MFGNNNSDWGQYKENGKSDSGYLFMFSKSVIGSRNKKQYVIAQCTVEAWYTALIFAVRETLWREEFYYLIGVSSNIF